MKKRIAILLTALLLLAGCDAAKSSSSSSDSSSSESSSSEVVASSSSSISSISSTVDDSYTIATLSDGQKVIAKTMKDKPLSEFGVTSSDGTYRKLFDATDLPSLMPPAEGKPLAAGTYLAVLSCGVVQDRWILTSADNMDGTSRALFLCDITTGKLTRMFAYTPPEVIKGTITSVYLQVKPLINGGDIYWDDVAKTRAEPDSQGGESDVNIWHYNTQTGKAEQIATQGWAPFLSDGQVCYYGNGGKPYTRETAKAVINKIS